jgi:WD40 repeat protein
MNSSDSNPFVGLRPFESDESLLFFGRQQQTVELLQRLHKFHFVALIGSSGSGKSSLIRAGLIPFLRAGYLVKNRDRWIIAMMKPGQSPLCNLAKATLNQENLATNDHSINELENRIKEEGVDAILDTLKPLWKEDNTNFFLLVDQFEELFRFSLDQKNPEKKDESIDFVNMLLELSENKHLPIYIVITMRSDFIGDCSQFYGFPEAINQSQYLVPRLNRIQLKNTIEGPVKLYNGKIAPALTAKLLNDIQLVKDELPLLQHALMRIWNLRPNSREDEALNLEDYFSIGGIEKALSNHADEALQGMTDEELQLTKKIFQTLTAIDEDGRKIRRPARLTQLEAITGVSKERLHSVVNRFIEDNRSFLVITKVESKDDELIDISHESLIRQWSTLNVWVDEEAESGKIFLRLTESADLYEKKEKDFLTGNELQLILHWYYTFKPGKIWAERYNSNYEKSLEYLRQSEAEAKKQRLKKVKTRRIVIASTIFVVMIILGFTFVIYKNDIKNKNQLVINYWQRSESLRAENSLLDALHFIAEAGGLSDEKELTKNLLIDGEVFLPKARLSNIITLNSIVTSAIFSPDGKYILAVTNDGTARLIDKITAKQTISFRQVGVIYSAVFSTDGMKILTSCNDGTARIWDVRTGKQILLLKHEDNVTSAVFSPDTKLILTSCSDGARLWDAAAGKQVAFLKNVAGVINAVFSPDGKLIITSGRDSAAHVWKLTAQRQATLAKSLYYNHRNSVTGAVFNGDGTKILTTNNDSTFSLKDIATGVEIFSVKSKATVTSAVFSPDGKWILTAGKNKTGCLWDATTGKQVGLEMKHDGPVYSAAFSPDGKWILTAGWDKVVRVWALTDKIHEIDEPIFSRRNISSAAFSTDAQTILTSNKHGAISILDLHTGNPTGSLKQESTGINALYSPDGRRILTTNDNSVHIWDASKKKEIASIKHAAVVTNSTFSSDGKKVVTITNHSNIFIWDLETLPATKPLAAFVIADINSAFLSPDEKKILIATGDSSAHIIDATTGKQIISFKHEDNVTSAVFSADGKFILTASWDYTARLWNASSGKQIGPVMKHTNVVSSAVFSPDGKWILTASWDSAVHLWSRVTFKEIGTSKKHQSVVNNAILSPDEKWIASLTKDTSLHLWELEGDLDIPPHLFKLQAKAITGVELNIETNETQCIQKEKWQSLNEEYYKKAREHYKVCKYLSYNLWRKFEAGEAKRAPSVGLY